MFDYSCTLTRISTSACIGETKSQFQSDRKVKGRVTRHLPDALFPCPLSNDHSLQLKCLFQRLHFSHLVANDSHLLFIAANYQGFDLGENTHGSH